MQAERTLRDWLRSLPSPREVAVEAGSFWPAFQSAVEGEVSAIRLVHPQPVKAIAAAKLKNDRVDSATLAHLLRCNLLPEAWRAHQETRERRQRVRLRISLGQHRAALKNQVHAILHQQGQRAEVSDVFGKKGQQWLAQGAGFSSGARSPGRLPGADQGVHAPSASQRPEPRGSGASRSTREMAGDDSRDWAVLGDGSAGGDRRRSALWHSQGPV